MTMNISINVLGELGVTCEGRPVVLPPSRKTRALLAYLALTARPHRRERLCEIFWDVPDDPRGALRWSLSKLRGVVWGERVLADRERVSLQLEGVSIDLVSCQQKMADDPALIPLGDLRDMAQRLSHPLLDGLDLPQSEGFQSWLIATRDEATALWHRILDRLLQHGGLEDHERLSYARAWLSSDPLAVTAVTTLSQVLRRTGRADEADEVTRVFRDTARAAGLDPVPEPETGLTTQTVMPVAALHQSIGFCQATDGVRIAYASVGEGPPLVKAANWLNHLELDWDSPIWGRTFATLAARNRLIRYDERGNGLSDWDVADISQAAFVTDLETVVDTLELARFPLIGMSQGCAVSIEYAVRHPDRVSALILVGGYAAGWRIAATAEEIERREAVMTLTRLGWGTSNSAYRHIFSQTFMPDGTPEDLTFFDEFQRLTTSAENAVRFQDAFGDIDVRHLLSRVQVPTLVIHARDDQRIRLDQGREIAMAIPDARFVTLESRNHILLGHEPAWTVAMMEIEGFLASVADQTRSTVTRSV